MHRRAKKPQEGTVSVLLWGLWQQRRCAYLSLSFSIIFLIFLKGVQTRSGFGQSVEEDDTEGETNKNKGTNMQTGKKHKSITGFNFIFRGRNQQLTYKQLTRQRRSEFLAFFVIFLMKGFQSRSGFGQGAKEDKTEGKNQKGRKKIQI